MTPNLGVKVAVLFKGECLNNGAFYRQNYYSALSVL